MRKNKLTALAIALVAAALLAFLVVYCVPVDRMAVHYRLNKVKCVIKPGIARDDPLFARAQTEGFEIRDEAGWFFKIPLVDQVRDQDKRIRVLDGALTQQQLADGNQVIPRVYVTWRITDPIAYERNLRSDEAEAVKRVKTVTDSQSGSVFGRHTLDELVNTDPDKLRFDEIEAAILAGTQSELSRQQDSYGLEVTSLGITVIAFPEHTTRAVYGRMQAERRRAAEGHRSEGQRLRSERRANATAEAQTILARAEAEATRIRAEGEQLATEYYDVFAKAPQLSKFLSGLEALQTIAHDAAESGHPITIVQTTDSPIFEFLEAGLRQLSAPTEPAAAGTQPDQSQPVSPSVAPAPAAED